MIFLTFMYFMLWSLSKDKVKSTANIFDDEEGDLFKEKVAALPEATVNKTDENKARAEKKVSGREDYRSVDLGHLVYSSGTQREVLFLFKCVVKNLCRRLKDHNKHPKNYRLDLAVVGFCLAQWFLTSVDDPPWNRYHVGDAKDCLTTAVISPMFIIWHSSE